MTTGQAPFCTKCGHRHEAGAAFCSRCGAGRPETPVAAAAAALPGGGFARLPWQMIVAGRPADIAGLVAAGAPIARVGARPSLRGPAVALIAVTLLDVAVALISDQPAPLPVAAVVAIAGVGAGMLGAIAGDGAGGLRRAAGLAAILAGLVLGGSAVFTAVSGLTTPDTLVPLIPSIVAQVASLVAAVAMAISAFGGAPRQAPQAAP